MQIERAKRSVTPSDRPRRRRRWFLGIFGSALVCLILFRGGFELGRFYEATHLPTRLLPAEFEHLDALLLAWSQDASHHEALASIAAKVHRRCHVILLAPDGDGQLQATESLRRAGIPAEAVTLVTVDVTLPWIRDYGPLQVKNGNGQYHLLDFDCFDDSKPSHDTIPQQLGKVLMQTVDYVPVSLEGGNVLSNGVGLCLTTTKVLEQNRKRGYSRRQVVNAMRRQFGASQIIFLEPLNGEPTSHIDMFATFTAPDTLVLGEYDSKDDPVNAAILDRNAERLSKVVTAAGKLQVHRIVMPKPEDACWYSYTNVTYANGTLLVPSYGPKHRESEMLALEVYRELLPNWDVESIDAQNLIQRQGALHCVTLGLPRMQPLGAKKPRRRGV